jgi:integrase
LNCGQRKNRVRVVEENEFAQLLKVCDNPTLKTLLEVACRQGLRRNELVNLRWAGVDRNIIKDLGGCSSVTVVEKHYTGDVAPAYRDAMDRMAKAAGA